jgi:hypothetical protein
MPAASAMSASMEPTTAMEASTMAAYRGISTAVSIAATIPIAATITITTVITEAYTDAVAVIPVGISIGVVRIGVTVCDRGRCGIIAGGWRSITWAGRLSRWIVAVARSLIGVALTAVGRILH